MNPRKQIYYTTLVLDIYVTLILVIWYRKCNVWKFQRQIEIGYGDKCTKEWVARNNEWGRDSDVGEEERKTSIAWENQEGYGCF